MSDIDAPFTSFGYEDTLSPDQQARLEGEPAWGFDLREHPVLPASQVQAILKAAADLPVDPRRALVMRFTLDAWSHIRRRDYRNAFLSAWTGIELTINYLWARHLHQKDVVGQRNKRLASWDVGRILEVLELVGVISSDLFRRLDRARELRNSVLHSGRSASAQDARAGVAALMEVAAAVWSLPYPRRLCDNLTLEQGALEESGTHHGY